MKGTGAKRNVCPGSCVSTGAKVPVALVESAPMVGAVCELSRTRITRLRGGEMSSQHHGTEP